LRHLCLMKITKPKFIRNERSLSLQLNKKLAGRRFVLLTDENVSEHCIPMLANFLHENQPLDIIEVESGEVSKSPEVCIQLWNHFIELGLSKSDLVVCLGGGSICDLGGFVATTFKRGMPFIFLPTTLLAMTDASIGGKNGVDSLDVKNVIGTISQPETILIYPPFYLTQDKRQYLSGLSEVVKHAVIAGGDFWTEVKSIRPDDGSISVDLLRQSVEVKYSIVKQDLYERDLRRVLNFGHTIGHAIESACMKNSEPLEHGIAVAAGMLVEAELAIQLKMASSEELVDLKKLIRNWFGAFWTQMPNWDQIAIFLEQDKKTKAKKNVFILPFSIGCVEIVEGVPLEVVKSAYNQSFI